LPLSTLQDKNIRVPNANRFRRRQDGDEQNPIIASASPAAVGAAENVPTARASSSATPFEEPDVAAPSSRDRSASIRRAAAASMQFEEDDASEDDLPPLTVNGKRFAVSKEDKDAESSNKRAKVGNGEASTSQATATPSRRMASYKHTQPGSIDFCAMCASKFTVTTYT
jgi:DNA repair protein RAD7